MKRLLQIIQKHAPEPDSRQEVFAPTPHTKEGYLPDAIQDFEEVVEEKRQTSASPTEAALNSRELIRSFRSEANTFMPSFSRYYAVTKILEQYHEAVKKVITDLYVKGGVREAPQVHAFDLLAFEESVEDIRRMAEERLKRESPMNSFLNFALPVVKTVTAIPVFWNAAYHMNVPISGPFSVLMLVFVSACVAAIVDLVVTTILDLFAHHFAWKKGADSSESEAGSSSYSWAIRWGRKMRESSPWVAGVLLAGLAAAGIAFSKNWFYLDASLLERSGWPASQAHAFTNLMLGLLYSSVVAKAIYVWRKKETIRMYEQIMAKVRDDTAAQKSVAHIRELDPEEVDQAFLQHKAAVDTIERTIKIAAGPGDLANRSHVDAIQKAMMGFFSPTSEAKKGWWPWQKSC